MKKRYLFYLILLLLISGSCHKDEISEPPTILNDIVAYYPFSGNANDVSGHNYNGNVYGAVLTTDRFGKANSAYAFDGITSYIDVNNTFFDNGWANMTFSVWFNSSANISRPQGGGQTIINTNPHNGFGIGYNYNSNLKIYSIKNSNPEITGSWDIIGLSEGNFDYSPVILNNWYHIAIVKSGLDYKFYLNGQLDKLISTTVAPIKYLCSLRFGGIAQHTDPNKECFSGKIDEIRVYNRALSQSEILYLGTH
jgi:trimeric autotransporter adhesin